MPLSSPASTGKPLRHHPLAAIGGIRGAIRGVCGSVGRGVGVIAVRARVARKRASEQRRIAKLPPGETTVTGIRSAACSYTRSSRPS